MSSTKLEYRMVVEPDAAAQAAGFRTRHYTYPKKTYAKAVKGITDHAMQRAEGRFENTWVHDATVYIETREVSQWKTLDLTIDADPSARQTSRPDSSPSNSSPR